MPRESEKHQDNSYTKRQKSFKLNDLRPLAVTSVFSKVFETAHYNGMSNYLTSNKLISSHQHGYIKGRSCETAILDLTMKPVCWQRSGHPFSRFIKGF